MAKKTPKNSPKRDSRAPLVGAAIITVTLGAIALHKTCTAPQPIGSSAQAPGVVQIGSIPEGERQQFLEGAYHGIGGRPEIATIHYDPSRVLLRESMRSQLKAIFTPYVSRDGKSVRVDVTRSPYSESELEAVINEPHSPALTVYDPELYATGKSAKIFFFRESFVRPAGLDDQQYKRHLAAMITHEYTHAEDFNKGILVEGVRMGNRGSLFLDAIGVFSDFKELRGYGAAIRYQETNMGLVSESDIKRFKHHLAEVRDAHRFVPNYEGAKSFHAMVDTFLADQLNDPVLSKYCK